MATPLRAAVIGLGWAGTVHTRVLSSLDGLALAAAGVHALIEKPLAPSLPAALALAEAFERAGLIGATGHTERHNPAIRHVALRLRAGDYGTVYQVSTRRQGP